MHSETRSIRRAQVAYHHLYFRFLFIFLTIILISCTKSMNRKGLATATYLWQNQSSRLLYVVYKFEKSVPPYATKAMTVWI